MLLEADLMMMQSDVEFSRGGPDGTRDLFTLGTEMLVDALRRGLNVADMLEHNHVLALASHGGGEVSKK
ncbi:hypothetical protein CLAFUW4_10353 [Fulvia fulva]|uniref:Uncharacterized protein n=1 Tax=Passalora fulva TaxID=5499 RepID=A0A9Q8P763_PASFU|nr:uncharacterized protein CLAFUR5_04968 [Fulvia fulva]KAK4616270.1 hypothetical protein CLAFUR4_10357 [Fulvia fulva]KAK4616803.1 hypothetical protein CLAFUR0_10357 [Fulvia fulva]UJO15764.1 hypothetical protein CLAFUR5_04968 [Fulvia fulva]WPV18880.1 hypothetical protein CLAFUW4_10353 [Fulvia fulva]WPV34473.1 hypothetical protein CLAFUW7_10353 [Fulvia fulva]